MKKFILFISMLLTVTAFAQNPTIKLRTHKEGNDTPKIIYAEEENKTHPQPAFFINGKFLNTGVSSLNPNQIDSISVIKDKITIAGTEYMGQVHIKTKSNYISKIISLNGLKEKYTNSKNKSTIFMIDDNLISGDYNDYFVDENYLISITIDKVENTKENIHIDVIKLITKSEENIRKSKQIIIRGNELAAN